jgi:hypothetical protein
MGYHQFTRKCDGMCDTCDCHLALRLRCFDCKRPIETNDDANVCIECGGRNALADIHHEPK